MDDGLDYEVSTKVRFLLNYDGAEEFNTLLLPDVQEAFVNHVKEVYERNDTLREYISGDLNFRFDGRRVDLEYVFSCCDENEAEAESFSEYCVREVQRDLEEVGCRLTHIACSADEADMAWLEELEDAIFGPRGAADDEHLQPEFGGMIM